MFSIFVVVVEKNGLELLTYFLTTRFEIKTLAVQTKMFLTLLSPDFLI
jgi:hypothetical protein